MAVKTYGYIRVSSTDQNEIRQLIAMRERNISKYSITALIFVSISSSKTIDRVSPLIFNVEFRTA